MKLSALYSVRLLYAAIFTDRILNWNLKENFANKTNVNEIQRRKIMRKAKFMALGLTQV